MSKKLTLSCVLEDAALFTGVADIIMEAAEQQATDRLQWRVSYVGTRSFYTAEATPTTRRKHFQVQSKQVFSVSYDVKNSLLVISVKILLISKAFRSDIAYTLAVFPLNIRVLFNCI